MGVNHPIPDGLLELAHTLEADWPAKIAELQASGVPLNIGIERTDADDLIPEEEAKDIIKGLPAVSASLTLMRRVTMSTKIRKQPVLSVLPQAYWVGGDTGLKGTTKAAWENKVIEAEELATLLPVPDAVYDDADYDLWGEVKPLITEAIGAKLDEATLFNLDSPFDEDGVLAAAIAKGQTITRGDLGDLANDIGDEDGLMSLVEDAGYAVNGFAARTRIKGALRGLRDENGGLLFQPSLQAGTPATLYGEPLAYPDGNGAWEEAEADLIAGDWSKAIIGVRQDLTFKVFDAGVLSDDDGKVVLNLIQQDSKVMRVVMRCGFVVANPINRKRPDEDERYPFSALLRQGS